MDWSKAKNILIAIFLLLNIVLLFTNYDTLSSGGSLSKELLADTGTILESRGIKLNCRIPADVTGATLEYESIQLDKAWILDKLLDVRLNKDSITEGKEISAQNKNLTFKDKGFIYIDKNSTETDSVLNVSDAEELLQKLLKRLNLPVSEFALDKQVKNADNSYILEYNHKYENYLIFDDYIKAVIGNTGVKELEYRFRKVKSIEKNKGQRLIEAYQVLIEASDIKDMGINSIDIGFKKDESDQDTQNSFDVLAWRIRLSDGSDKYYNALNGNIMN